MRRITFAAFALGVWIIPLPKNSGQPSAGVPEKVSGARAQHAENAREKQQAAETAALNSVLAAITEDEQELAKARQQETTVESENNHLQRWVIGVGIVQALVFFGTLLAIKRQANIMEEQTRDAAIEIVRLNRAYLSIDAWMPDDAFPSTIGIKARIYNPSRTAVRIESVEYSCDNSNISLTCIPPSGRMLTPQESYWAHIVIKSLLSSDDPRNTNSISFSINGRIAYTDIFHRTRHRTFAKSCPLGGIVPIFEDVDGVGCNDEEGWDKDG